MSDSVLSDEERDALRADVESQGRGRIDDVQLGTDDKFLRRAVPRMESRFLAFAERARSTLSKELRMTLDDAHLDINVLNANDFGAAVGQLVPGAELTLPDFGRLGFLGFNPPLATILVDVAYGATITSDAQGTIKPRKSMSEVERQTIAPIHATLCKVLEDKVFQHKPGPLTCVTLAQHQESNDSVNVNAAVAFTYGFLLKGERCECTVILLAGAIELLLSDDRTSLAAHARMMVNHVQQTRVCVTAMLGSAHMSLSDVASLTPGQMIWLESSKSEHLSVLVENELKFLADPIQRHGVMGIQIVSRLP